MRFTFTKSVFLSAALALSSIIFSSVAVAHDHKGMKQTQDIVDIAASNPDFSTLVAAVKAAGLVDALKGDGPLTVFAPTNAAFEKLPAGTVEELLKPENKDKLVSILTYHVVPGQVKSTDVVKVDSATSLQGQDIAVSTKYGKVKVDNANVIKTDIMASNGVIHVIDTVILPEAS